MGSIAQIGYGHWGTNLARNLNTLAGTDWRYLVESSPEQAAKARALYPHLRTTDDVEQVLADDDVTAVVIVTPAATHADLATRALRAGKHVMVEKPLALSTADAVALAELADSLGLVLMVGHTFEFVPAVRTMREYVTGNELGDVLYLHSQRLNLGRIQTDINAFWSIGPHDVSIANYLLGTGPEWVSARGARYLHHETEDVMFVTLGYPGGILAHAHVSWLDPSKTRRTTVVGSKRMLVYDDMDSEARLKIFDKGADRLDPDAYGAYQYKLRDGAMLVPSLPMVEPLAAEIKHFLDCVRTGSRPRTDGWNGARVVAALEAADRSLRNDGAPAPVTDLGGPAA
ncbi:oxidoreductase [Actinoplanes philippinensis]|uniref:Predicted dehydrogenase n=1 Tax=Actinoplanes philippinensis TaxID=35752 RepID=A0A1I2GVH5_9ACTN|nr:Gfo/Idh/MocA family oxidoreductase [Actinoplanes philippinensis]GIE78114.1 oxidoreductase [Actinoplanes philippinensis]SFF21143.1 Predicted dehydrogenase [Actinoplanes philippinensis]